MNAIIIIILLATTLYYSGVIKKFVIACSIPDDTPATVPLQEPPKEVYQEPGPDPLQNVSRLELEALAADWMKEHKIKHWYVLSRISPNDVLIEMLTDN